MKRTIEPKQTWGEAIFDGLLFTLLCALAATIAVGVGALIVMTAIAMFNFAWWLPFVLIIPVIMILVFRYTGFNDFLDSKHPHTGNLPPR